MNTRKRICGALINWMAAVSVFPAVAHADPIAELRSVSVFKDAELSKLSGGDVLANRGPAMRFSRGLSVESAFIVRAPVKTTLGLLQNWNPTRHSELKVYISGDLSGKGPSEFQSLSTAPANSSVRAFVEATEKLPGDPSKLQLSSAEAKEYAPGSGLEGAISAPVVTFWSQVLAQRVKSFLAGGLSSQPAYQTAGGNIVPEEEIAALLKESPSARSQFGPLISSTAIGGGRGSVAPNLYWQLFDVEGQAAVSLNAFYARPDGDGWQTADLGYYGSGGFYALVSFHQLWPVQVNGSDATLVWRVDLTSASALSELRGVERLGSGAAMMREVQKGVKAFLKDTK
ncbi:MAG: hypothetical protein JOZ08_08300 [Verrucomicrobia bacterium]|nr:hypothetical protein [Verrucomicrobiota bacterium]